jgi:putative ubiquitin-RnfH superfamily antitoxin RatB of RatAB toxin-antitoxin module
MGEASQVRITVAYALPDVQHLIEMRVDSTTSVDDAVLRSGLQARCPELRLPAACAIYGRPVPGSHLVVDGDRIEILRPLLMVP